LHLDLSEQVHNLFRLKSLRRHDRSSSSEFSLISLGTKNPGQVTAIKRLREALGDSAERPR
ncbi:MAG: hypothetical protein ACRD2P_02815, partial [Terriglobia bacterium]